MLLCEYKTLPLENKNNCTSRIVCEIIEKKFYCPFSFSPQAFYLL